MDAKTIRQALDPYGNHFPTYDGIEPGEVVSARTPELAEALLPPEVATRVALGDFELPVAATGRYPLPSAYVEATVANATRVTLDSNGDIVGYEAGLPFPVISTDDGEAGLKIAWNLRYRSLGGDSEALTVSWKTLLGAAVEGTQDMMTWRLRLSHRCTLTPRDHQPNPLDLYEVSVSQITNPPALNGWLSASYRYRDPSRSDDTWVYAPKEITALRSDYRAEDGYGYHGPVHTQTWRYLGRRLVLAGVGLPTGVPKFGGRHGWYPDCPFQLRDTHVVETIARDPDHHYARRVFYIDSELWMPVYTVGFDKGNECFKLVFHLFSDPAHNPWVHDVNAGPINLGGCAIDFRRNHATLLPNVEQRFNEPVDDHPYIQAALSGKAPVDADVPSREGFRWIAIGHTAELSEVIPGRLFRSGLPNQRLLDEAKIDLVINLSGRNPTDLERTAASGRMFVYWPIEDDELPDLDSLRSLGTWVTTLLQHTDKRVLVHCVASVNRSNLVIGQILHQHLGLGGPALVDELEASSEGYAILTNVTFRHYLESLP